MSRVISVALALVMLLGCLASCGEPEATADVSSKTESSEDTYVPYYEVPEGYCDVNMAIRKAGASTGWDVSEYFDPDAKGYAIYDGTYMVDAETLRRLTEVPVVGDGEVIWTYFKIIGNNPDPFMGYIPVEKLHDPVYMSMHLPSELQTYMFDRVNPSNMGAAHESFTKLMTIGAIYKEVDTILPDDAEITVCFGRTVLLGCTEEEGWHVLSDLKSPSVPNSIYYLPWELEHTIGVAKIPTDRIRICDDHVEVKLTGKMLNGKYSNKENVDLSKAVGSVLHFWGKNAAVDGSKMQGCVAGYVAWIKEPEYVGKVAAAVGADWRTAKGEVSQAFSGYNYKLTTEPRLIFGHNVGPIAYDDIMDTEKVQQLLGLK